MLAHRGLRNGRKQGLAVEAGLEDGLDAAVTEGLQGEGAPAGSFEAVGAIGPAETEDAQAGAKALFGVRTRPQDAIDQLGRGRPGLLGPPQQPTGRPLEMAAMGLGYRGPGRSPGDPLGMCRVGGEAPGAPAAEMAGNPPAAAEDLHCVRTQADLAALTGELIGNAVVMAVDLEVVIDADLRHLPDAELVGPIRKRLQRRPIQALEQTVAASRQLLEGAVIEPGKPFGDDRIRLGEGEEGEVADAGQDPALGDQDPGFDFGLILGLAWPGRDDGAAVVRGQLLVGTVELGLVAMGAGNADPRVIRVLCPPALCAGGPRHATDDEGSRRGIPIGGHITIRERRAN